MAEIQTERLVLRPARASDVTAFHAIMSDAQAMAYWSTPPHQDLAQTRAWLDSMLGIELGVGEDFVVDYEGELIGKAGFYRFPEIGFILDRSHWGRGFAFEALHAVVDRAFGHHQLPAVEADVDPRNARSLQVLARLGAREIGRASATWQVGDEWCDSVYLRLHAADWKLR
jgi:ribosomal-protein-alanine N-acetyltransferase